jgi:hypothetical protein
MFCVPDKGDDLRLIECDGSGISPLLISRVVFLPLQPNIGIISFELRFVEFGIASYTIGITGIFIIFAPVLFCQLTFDLQSAGLR